MKRKEIDFLHAKTIIHVVSKEQSEFIINFCEENGVKRSGGKRVFDVDTYKEYPYYYIDSENKLNANMTKGGAINWAASWDAKVKKFDDVFEMDSVKDLEEIEY